MRRIVHLSDLHFGRTDPAILEPLVATVERLQPHLVTVSGDFTQRAREREFRQAREFLDRLPGPQIVVPGNHDVPLHNVWHRFLQPLTLYRRYIANDMTPFFLDDEMAVAGVNTARSLTWKGGRINRVQVGDLIEKLCELEQGIFKIVVTHHPFDLPSTYGRRHLVGRAPMAMSQLARCRADVFLAGHMHLSYTGHTAERYRMDGYSALVVQAGTATSTRGRGERNSFNLLTLEHPRVTVERYTWSGNEFAPTAAENFERVTGGWARLNHRTA